MEHVGKEIANYLRANKITQEEVAGAFGVSQAYISALLSGKKAFGKKTAELWHNHFGFNRTFLLTGEGDLMDVQVTRMDHPKSVEKLGDAEVPLYDIDAAANLRTLMGDKTANILGRISIPNIPSCDGAVYVRGDSMYPLLKTGDISAYWARHTFATLLAELDTPIDTISLALGHSYGSKVTQVYINPDLRKADEAVRRLIDYVYRK